MGGAFIGVADDWTAIYWNPAGLAQLKDSGVGVTIDYLSAKAHDSNGLANPVAPLAAPNIMRGDAFVQLGGEPQQFNALDSQLGVPLPAIGGYTHWHGFSLAGGVYAPLGFSFDVEDHSTPGYNVSFKSEGYILNSNFSIAHDLGPWVSAGAGVNLVNAEIKRTSLKEGPIETLSTSSSASGVGVQGLFGLLAHLGPKFQAGAVYRTGQDINMKGDASISDSLFPLATPLGPLQNESSGFQQALRNPTTYGVGILWRALPTLHISADWQRTEWSASRVNIQFDQPGVLLQNQNLNPGWNSTSRYRFGLEWTPTPTWSFQAGYFRDPRAVSFESEALTQQIDADQRYYTAGVSYRWKRYRFLVGEQYDVGDEVIGSRQLRKEATDTSVGVEYLF
jgi:long-chain fatty acid transport protein